MRTGYPRMPVGGSAWPGGRAESPGAVSGAPARKRTEGFGADLAALIALMLSVSLVLTGCELMSGRTGGGTETETAGILQHADGSPAVSARVVVRPADYVADSLLTAEEVKPRLETWTDAAGRFRMKGLPTGAYRLEAQSGNGRGLVKDFALEREGQSLSLPRDTLRPNGSILGSFADSAMGQGRFVQVFGLERLVKADPAGGVFMINGLPPGEYDLRFLSLEPFRKQAILRKVRVLSGEVTRLDPIALEELARLSFTVDSGRLAIEGVDAGSPVIFDNEFWDNGVDDEYVWARASAGRLQLRGNVVSDAMRKNAVTLDAQLLKAGAELKAARLAGMQGIPDPVAGSRRSLLAAASGRIEDMDPERSAGSDLMVAEALKATPENPLVVVAGGTLTTVANAYLTDPTIAPRMVVLSVYPFTINSADSLATYVVAKRCRMVVWGRDYVWTGALDSTLLDRLPANRLGERTRAKVRYLARGGNAALGDMAPIAWLLGSKVWTGATLARVQPPLAVQPASGLSFDFLDIPKSANDWHAYQEDFFAALADTQAYPPAALPGRLEAEGYAKRSGALPIFTVPGSSADTSLGHDAMAGPEGAWLEHRVSVAAAGDYKAAARFRSASGGRLAIGTAGGAAPVELTVPAGTAWSEAETALRLEAGTAVFRVTWIGGSIDLDWVEIR